MLTKNIQFRYYSRIYYTHVAALHEPALHSYCYANYPKYQQGHFRTVILCQSVE